MANSINAVRGTRDLLPPETETWNFVEAAVRDVFRVYNFREIRTPILEDLQLFQRSVGEYTDIVSKELYVFREGASAKGRSLERAWLVKYAQDVRLLVPEVLPGVRYRPDYKIVYSNQNIGLIEIKTDLRPESIQTLRSYVNNWLAFRPTEPFPRAIIVVPAGSISAQLRQLAENHKIEIEEIRLEDADAAESLALRPENTAGVVRAYIEHRLWGRPGLQRFYYIGPQFRRERPQKGRYRQFYQIGAEVIGPSSAGSESPAVDAEVLEMLASLFDRLEIKGWTLELNSVGCAKDRPVYLQVLRDALKEVVHTMCPDCQRRAVTNPLRVLDCKVTEDQSKIERLPRISDYLDEDCRTHFAEVQKILVALDVPFVLNNRLVRGLDYYTRTAFEFTHGALGAQNAILGGGRYDGLSESLGGPAAPGIGFAIGEDRLVMALQESGAAAASVTDVYIAPLGEGMNVHAAVLARDLRRQGIVVTVGDETFRLKKSLETASKTGARFALILGENEVASGQFALKNLATGEQVSVAREEIFLKSRA